MAPQPPLILVDNVFDRINLYPAALPLTSDRVPVVGREMNFIADYRRERTYWHSGPTDGNGAYVQVDLGAGNSQKGDSIWLDRGHTANPGSALTVYGSNDNFSTFPAAIYTANMPAVGTVGGDPTTGWCITEEGAAYSLVALTAACRYWRVTFAFATYPNGVIVPGIILGKRVQLSSPAGWSSVVDEDAGERSERMESSLVPGYEGSDRTYSARKVELRLAYIGATEYDSVIRGLRRTLYEVGQPAVVCMDYGTHPERAWLYRYSGKSWSSPIGKGVYRNVSIPMTEVGPLIR